MHESDEDVEEETRRIYKSKKTHIKKYPFLVSIHVMSEFVCAGFIISRELVGGHCCVLPPNCLQQHPRPGHQTQHLRALRKRLPEAAQRADPHQPSLLPPQLPPCLLEQQHSHHQSHADPPIHEDFFKGLSMTEEVLIILTASVFWDGGTNTTTVKQNRIPNCQ